MPLPRRDFLRLSAATAGLALVPSRRAHGQAQSGLPLQPSPPTAPARNIIFMAADGMSSGTLQLADLFSRQTRQRPLHWTSLWNQPGVRRASCSTYSADGWVTDSSAAASTWGIGERINNGAVNTTPDGRTPEPILITARKAGKATGVVTTTRVTHATPAGFYANCPNRDLEGDIGDQLLSRNLDVALGGGAADKYVRAKSLAARPDLRVVRTRAELAACTDAAPLLGLFDQSHLRYSLDRPDTQPTLADMTTAALRLLPQKPAGFILQIEGGRVDQAAHANDAASMLQDMLAFDDAVSLACDFASAHADTLLVITTDHGCGNPGLTLYANEGVKSFERLGGVTHSFEWIIAQGSALSPDARERQLPEIIEHATAIGLSKAERETLAHALRGERVNPFLPANTIGPVLGSILANHLGVAFLSPNHTSDYVEVTALGPGSERLQPLIENTWLHSLMLASLVPVHNP